MTACKKKDDILMVFDVQSKVIIQQNPGHEMGEMNEEALDISLLPHFPLLHHTFVNHATWK